MQYNKGVFRMLYIVTALYCEAKPWIKTYCLKKDTASKRFQIFYSDEIVLIITNQGKLNAAIAITELFHSYPPTKDSLLLNVGIAASFQRDIPTASGFLCNKIVDTDTKKTYYPDFLFGHNFTETSLCTVSNIVKSSEDKLSISNKENILYDMEASGIYTAATMFLKQHQLLFYKIVSDHGMEESITITPDSISAMMEKNRAPLFSYTQQIRGHLSSQANAAFTQQENELVCRLSEALHCSVTMDYSLRQLFLYYKLSQGNLIDKVDTILNTLSETPCSTKKEGKKYIEQLKSELI